MTESNIWAWRGQKDILTKDEGLNKIMNEWVTEVFVEQPLALPGSAKKIKKKNKIWIARNCDTIAFLKQFTVSPW